MNEGAKSRRERGALARQMIMGEEWASAAKSSRGLAAFTEQAVEHVWCAVWGETSLEMRLKSLSTLSALIALGHLDELRPHVAGALRSDLLTAEELRAVALHLAPYVGYPAARHAMVVIDDVVAALGSDRTDGSSEAPA